MILSSRSLRVRGLWAARAGIAAAAFVIGLLSLQAGCHATGNRPALPQVRAQAERDLDCPGSEIRIEEELTGMFKAVGCGRKARYRAACEHLACTVSHEDGQAIPWRDRPEPGSLESQR
jgi:hypothetical protein